MLEVTLQAKNFSELKKIFRRRKKKICHQFLSMKVQLEPVLQEDHELLGSWEIISRICCSPLKM